MISKLLYKVKNNKQYLNSFWSLIGSVLPKLGVFITSILLARILEADRFGDLSIVRSTINMFTIFAASGIGITATKFISEHYNENFKNENKVAEIISLVNFVSLVLGIIISLGIIIFSNQLSEIVIGKKDLRNDLIIGAMMLLFNALNAAQIGIIAGFQKYKTIAINSTLAIFISLPFQVLGAIYFEIEGALFGFAINFLLLYLFNKYSIYKLTKGFKIKLLDFRKNYKILYQFTLPSSLSGLMVMPITWVTTVLLTRSINGSFNLGIFEAANQIKMVIIFIPIALSNVLLPTLMERNNNKNDLNKTIKNNLLLNISISLIICLVICLFSRLIMSLFGQQFKDYYLTLIILSISTVFMAANNVIGQIIASKGKMWIGFLFNFLWGITLILSSYIFIYHYKLGALSLALAYLVSYLLHTFWQFAYLKLKYENNNNIT